MQKNSYVFLLLVFLTFSLCGCGGKELESDVSADGIGDTVETQESLEKQDLPDSQDSSEKQDSSVKQDLSAQQESSDIQQSSREENDSEENEENFSFKELRKVQFLFSSGAGGWGTTLVIREDGSFSGEYSDSNMGDTGEGYPAGTVYQCNFTGQFTNPVKVNEYTYTMKMAEMNYEKEPGTEEIKDDMHYIYAEAYGLSDADNVLIYLPGTPLAELNEDFRGWVGYYDLSRTEETVLPFYALNNESQQQGFCGRDMGEDLRNMLAFISERAAELEDSITNEPLSQSELNEKSMELYNIWDGALNTIWMDLKQTRDAQTMSDITGEEREWIERKEQEIRKAGAEFEGGSMQPMLENLKGAELTKERVYELLEIFEKN